jgi:hypothetical protein
MGFLWDLPIKNGDFLAKFPSNPMVNVAQNDVLAEALHSACFSPKGEQATHGDHRRSREFTWRHVWING